MGRNFKIHCMCVVKNEADVIAHTLTAASEWADYIYVYDNGSSDGTWEIVQSLKNDTIIPWKQSALPFCESLRGELFEAFRHRSTRGDWWCRLDSDEFYIDDPREFLAGVPRWLHVVWGLSVQYYITRQDLHSLNFDLPVSELLPQLKYYNVPHAEIRFFRYRPRMQWPERSPWPVHMGAVYAQMIRYRHYKYRSPAQVQSRLKIRANAIRDGFDSDAHYWNNSEWKLPEADTLHFDDGSNQFAVDLLPEHRDPFLRHLMKILLSETGIWP